MGSIWAMAGEGGREGGEEGELPGAGAGGGSRAGAAAPHTAAGRRGGGGGAGAVPLLGWRPSGFASLFCLSSGPLTPEPGSLRTSPACQGLLK